MTKKPRLGHDPFKDEGPLSFIRDTRAGKLSKPGNTDNNGNTILPGHIKRGKGRPRGSGAPDRAAWIRATFIVRRARLEKMKALAYWERQNLKQILDLALESYLKGRVIEPIPEKQ